MKDNTNFLKEIIWYDIDKKGCVNKPLKNEAVVYIYKTSSNTSKSRYYVGSTIRLASRVGSHRGYVINWDDYKKTRSSIFYGSILKNGWSNFKFGILEYIDVSNIKNIIQKKEILLEREQYYLDNINPSLNICKIAGSSLGVKRNIAFSLKLSKSRRGKSKNPTIKINDKPKVITSETKQKISLRCKGISVKIYDQLNNLVGEFATITSAAKYLGLTHKTISMIFKTGKSYDNFIYKFCVKDVRIWVYNLNHKLVNILDNRKRTSVLYNISYCTLNNYIKSGKLYKNKFYFYDINSNNKNNN